ncbi:hypothetical protein M8C17_01315 [Micromonospora sp. RHAY321]|uniref:hypothetical protein n=1 Tax=Micromonospora sp. RHAY321 TaxID=2944807 RepID=UPI00207C8C96|nr:hypothetical protein [Micromonospora sp. RHAY321]MCO1593799.1 hypothetical protein [Micromonospora sp. RHAY321]
MDEFFLRWRIGSPGSATFSLDFPQEAVEVHTTYVGDGLGSVLQAALDLQGGSSSAIAFLPAEPGGTCLFFAGADSLVYLQVVDFDDMSSEAGRWGGGRLRWNGHVSVERFVRQTVTMAEHVLVKYKNAAAYSAAWGGVLFPDDKLRLLRDRIGDDASQRRGVKPE